MAEPIKSQSKAEGTGEGSNAPSVDLKYGEAAFQTANPEVERQLNVDETEKLRAQEAELVARERAGAERRLRRRTWFMIGAMAATLIASGIATYFGYNASLSAKSARIAEEHERVQRDIAEAATRKEREQRGIAEHATREAKDQTRIAESRRVAAISRAERDKRLDRALLLAVEAHDISNTWEARNVLLGSLMARPGLVAFLQSSEDDVKSVAFSPDGKTLAAGCNLGGVVLWDTSRRLRLPDQPLAVAEGHVESVSFSPDGKILAAGYAVGAFGGEGGGVVLWDPTRRSRLLDQPMAVKEGQVLSVAFSPDGKTLAAAYLGAKGGGVVLWDAARRSRLPDQPMAVEEGEVWSVAFSPDSKTLAAGCGFAGAVLWDITQRSRLPNQPLRVPEGYVKGVGFSPDGKSLAAGYSRVTRQQRSGGEGGGVALWDVGRRERLPDQPIPIAEGSVQCLAFTPDGKTLAAGYITEIGVDRGRAGVVLWDTTRRSRLPDQPMTAAEGSVMSLAISRDGKTLAAGYGVGDGYGVGRGGVVLWDTARRSALSGQPLAVDEGAVDSVAFSPDGKTLAAGFRYTSELARKAVQGSRADFSESGVVLWDTTLRSRLADQPLAVAEGDVTTVAFSPDGKVLAAGFDGHPRYDHNGGVVLWDTMRRSRLPDQPLVVDQGRVSSVAFSPDGKTLAAGYESSGRGGVVLWDTTRRSRLPDKPLAAQEGDVNNVAFSPDGKTLAAGGGYAFLLRGHGGVVLWDTTRRSRLPDLPLNLVSGQVASVAFSPDGKTMAAGHGFDGLLMSGARRGSVALWDTGLRPSLRNQPLSVVEGNVRSVAFSPDGKTLAAGCGFGGSEDEGGGVVLWDTTQRLRLHDQPLVIADGGVKSVAFSPDGKTLAAGYGVFQRSGGVVLWDVDLASWRRHAGAIANRNMSREEWQEYFPDKPYRRTFDWLPESPGMEPTSKVKTPPSPSPPSPRS